MKKLLRSTVFLLPLFIILLVSCQDDDKMQLKNEKKGNLFFKTGKLEDFSSLKSYAKELEQKSHYQTNTLSKSSLEENNGFEILEDEEIFVYTGEYSSSYTIPIREDNQLENTFSNLVVHFNNELPTEAFIITYTPTQGYVENYKLDNKTPFSGEAIYKKIDYDGSLDSINQRGDCSHVFITYCRNDGFGGEGDIHVASSGCYNESLMWTESYTFCPESDGESAPESIAPPNGPSSGGGSTPNQTEDPSNTTDPNEGENCIVDSNGDCLSNEDVVTSPKPPVEDKHIERLKQFTSNSVVKNKLLYLKTQVAPSGIEDGFQFDLISEPPLLFDTPVLPILKAYNQTKFPALRNNTKIVMHLHPRYALLDNGQLHRTNPIFSKEDIDSFLDSVYSIPDEDFTSILVSDAGVFALRVTNSARASQVNNKLNRKKHYRRYEDEYYSRILDKHNTTNAQNVTDFNNFIKEFQFSDDNQNANPPEIGLGITLYKAIIDSDGNITWVEV